MPRYWTAVTLAAALVLAACNSEVTEGPGAPPLMPMRSSPLDVLEASRQAMAGLTAYVFEADLLTEGMRLAANGTLQPTERRGSVIGVWTQGDRYQLEFMSELDGVSEGIQAWIGFGERWIRETNSGWRETLPNVVGVPRVRGRPEAPDLDTARFTGGINTSPLFQVTGEGMMALLEAPGSLDLPGSRDVPETVKASAILVIGQNDLLLRRSQVTWEFMETFRGPGGNVVGEALQRQVWTIDFSRYNVQFSIELPEGFSFDDADGP